MLRAAPTTLADRLTVILVQAFPRLLGALFAYTAWQKISNIAGLHAVLEFDGLPASLIGPVGWSVIGIELALAAALLTFVGFRRLTMLAAIVVLGVFSLQIGYLLLFAEAPNCSCLQAELSYESARRSNFLSLLRNLCLLLPAAWVLLQLSPAPQASPKPAADLVPSH